MSKLADFLKDKKTQPQEQKQVVEQDNTANVDNNIKTYNKIWLVNTCLENGVC